MPLVFSTNSGMGQGCNKFYSVLLEMIATRRKQEYCITTSWLQENISFSLMRSTLSCICGNCCKNLNQEEMSAENDIEYANHINSAQTISI